MASALRGLTAQDRAKWEKEYSSKLQGKTQQEIDDIYRISRIHKRFGNHPDYQKVLQMSPQKQIEFYNNQTYLDDWNKRFGNQNEFAYRDGTITKNFLDETLSDEAKAKLMKNPAFKSDSEIEDTYKKSMKSVDEPESNQSGFWGWFNRAFSTDPETGERPERIIKDTADAKLSMDRKQQKSILEDVVNEDNLNVVDKIDTDGSVDKKYKEWEQKYGTGEDAERFILQQANDMLNGKTVLFNGEYLKFPGSNYYKAFKDTDTLKDFKNGDKKRLLAIFETLSDKKGAGFAMNAIESWMERYVSEHQSKDWATNTLNDVWVGGWANIANKLMGLEAIYVAGKYGDEGLGKWLSGIDPETGQFIDGWWKNKFYNPNYWRKVEDYGTFDEEEHKQIDENGGITPNHNIYGTSTPQLWSWQTANEALKMTKFLWSDYLVGRVLGGASKFGTKLAGGKFSAAGDFLAKESPKKARAFNKLAAYGTVGMSAVGISEAYGKMTFDQVQRAGYDLIMKKVNADVEKMLDVRMNDDDTKQVIENYVAAKTQQAVSEGASKDEIAKNQEIWRKEGTGYARMQLQNILTEQQKAAHQEDFDEADRDAAQAYMWDATLEEGRMAFTNAIFKQFLFSKGTRKALSNNNPYLKNTYTTSTGSEVSARPRTIRIGSKKPGRGIDVRADRFSQNVGMIWNGFFSNYLDDVTVGFGKGFGNNQFHNYLAAKYEPETYDKLIDNFWYRTFDNLNAAVQGAQEASMDYQSFYDGMIGALGSFTNAFPKLQGFKELAQKDGRKKLKTDEHGNKLSTAEIINKFMMTPLLDNYSQARQQEREAQRYLEGKNTTLQNIRRQIFSKHQDDIDETNELLTNVNKYELAKESRSMQQSADAKTDLRFSIISTLNELSKSPVYEHNEWVIKTRQQIKDLAEENVSEEEKEKLIDQFMAQPANKRDGQSEFTREEAWERLVENAKELQDMDNMITEVTKKLDNDPNVYNNPMYKKSLIKQRVTVLGNTQRLRELNEKITGNPAEDESAQKYDKINSQYAEFGSHSAWEIKKKTQEEYIDSLKSRIKKLQEHKDKLNAGIKKGGRRSRNNVENQRELRMTNFSIKSLNEELQDAKRKLDNINVAEKIFYDTTMEEGSSEGALKVMEHHGKVLTEEEIMDLDPVLRYEMLDPSMLSNYSKEQQDIIKEIVKNKMQDNPSFLSDLSDAAKLYERVNNDQKSYQKFLENPIESYLYEVGFKNARLRALAKNRLKTQREQQYNLITEAIDNGTLEEYLENNLLNHEIFEAYLEEKNPPEEVRKTIQKYIDSQKTINEDLDALLDDINKDKDISDTDKKLLEEAVEFLRYNKIDPNNEDDITIALTTGSLNNMTPENPTASAFEDFINDRNSVRPVDNKVDTSELQGSDAKVLQLKKLLWDKMKGIAKDRANAKQVEQAAQPGAEGSGASVVPENVEPTPTPEPAPEAAPAEEKGKNKKAPEDEPIRDASKLMALNNKIKSSPVYKNAINWLNDNPTATAEDLYGYIRENSKPEDAISQEEAMDIVRYFRDVKPSKFEDIGETPPPKDKPKEGMEDEGPAQEISTEEARKEITSTVDKLIKKSTEGLSWLKSYAVNAINAVLGTRNSTEEGVTNDSKQTAMNAIKNAFDAASKMIEESNITSNDEIMSKIRTALGTVVNTSTGAISKLVKKFKDVIDGKAVPETVALKIDPFDILKDQSGNNDSDASQWSSIVSINMEAISREYSENPGDENYSPNAEFISKYGIIQFLQNHSVEYLHKKDIFFMCPSLLANAWKSYIESNEKKANDEYVDSAPVVAVIEVSKEEVSEHIKEGSEPIRIGDKYYQPIAIMPSTSKDTPGAARLSPIRQRINVDKNGNISNVDELITVDKDGVPVTAVLNGIFRDNDSMQWPEHIPEDQPNKGLLDAVSPILNKEDSEAWNRMSQAERSNPSNSTILNTLLKYCIERFSPYKYTPEGETEEATGIMFNLNNGRSDGTNFTEPVFIKAMSSTTLRGSNETILSILKGEESQAIDKLITNSSENNSILEEYFKSLKDLLLGKDGLSEMLTTSNDAQKVVIKKNKVSRNQKKLNEWIDNLNRQLGYFVNLGDNKYSYHISDGKIHLDILNKNDDYISNGESILEISTDKLTDENINSLMLNVLKNTMLNNSINEVTDEVRRGRRKSEMAKWQVDIENLLKKDGTKKDAHRRYRLEQKILDGIFEVSKTSLVYPKSAVVINAPFTSLSRGEKYVYEKPRVGSPGSAGPINGGTSGDVVNGKGQIINTDTGTIVETGKSEEKDKPKDKNVIKRKVESIKKFIDGIQDASRQRKAALKQNEHRTGDSSIPTVFVTTLKNAFDDVHDHDPYRKSITIDLKDVKNPFNPISRNPFEVNGIRTNSIEHAYEIAKSSLILAIATGTDNPSTSLISQEGFNKLTETGARITGTQEQIERLQKYVDAIMSAEGHADIVDAKSDFNEYLNQSENKALKESIDQLVDLWSPYKSPIISLITREYLKTNKLKASDISTVLNTKDIEFADEYISALNTQMTNVTALKNGERPTREVVSTTLGDIMDEFNRDLFDVAADEELTNTKPGKLSNKRLVDMIMSLDMDDVRNGKIPPEVRAALSKYKNFSMEGKIKYFRDVYKWKRKMEEDNWVFVSKDLHLGRELPLQKKKGGILKVFESGDLDLLAYNTQTGEMQIYDIKTMKVDKVRSRVKVPADPTYVYNKVKENPNLNPQEDIIGDSSVKSFAEFIKKLYGNIFGWKAQLSMYADMAEYNGQQKGKTLPVSGINNLVTTLKYDTVNEGIDSRYEVNKDTGIIKYNGKPLALEPIFQPVVDNKMIEDLTGSPRFDIDGINTDLLEKILQKQRMAESMRQKMDNSNAESTLNRTIAAINNSLNEQQDKAKEEQQAESDEKIIKEENDDPVVGIAPQENPVPVNPLLGFAVKLNNAPKAPARPVGEGSSIPMSEELTWETISQNENMLATAKHYGIDSAAKWASSEVTDEMREQIRKCSGS